MNRSYIPESIVVKEVYPEKGHGFAYRKNDQRRIHFLIENHGIPNYLNGSIRVQEVSKDKKTIEVDDVIVARILSRRQGLFIKKWVFIGEMKEFLSNLKVIT